MFFEFWVWMKYCISYTAFNYRETEISILDMISYQFKEVDWDVSLVTGAPNTNICVMLECYMLSTTWHSLKILQYFIQIGQADNFHIMFSTSAPVGLNLFCLVDAILGSLSEGICFPYCFVPPLFTIILLKAIPETAEPFCAVHCCAACLF